MEQKILLVGWGLPPNIEGGLDIHVANLYFELKDLGFNVDLAVLEDFIDKEHEGEVVGLKSESEDMMSRSSEISRQVAELADDYDIVHTHDWFGVEAGFKAQKYSGCKWVTTFHSLSSGRSRNPSKDIMELERQAVKDADQVIAVSEKLGAEIEKEFDKTPKVIYNGFSEVAKNGKDVRKELEVSDNMILYIGRHAEQKGVEHLIYGFSKLLEKKEATLVLGGDGHLRNSLETFAELLGVDDNVIFAGYIPDKQLGDYYDAADVFVSPSINEPFGLTVTEALQFGTPVVATDTGVSEILPDDAVIDAEPESNSLRKGILKALEKESVEDFKKRSWNEMAKETAKIYEELS